MHRPAKIEQSWPTVEGCIHEHREQFAWHGGGHDVASVHHLAPRLTGHYIKAAISGVSKPDRESTSSRRVRSNKLTVTGRIEEHWSRERTQS
jgi:hypothetical protein